MIGLGWFKPRGKVMKCFSRRNVANAVAEIAGGDPEQYLSRAGQMILAAKKLGQIERAEGAKTYYRFIDPA